MVTAMGIQKRSRAKSERACYDKAAHASIVSGYGGYKMRPSGNENTESYASVEENGFRNSRSNPLSTFSIDVDNASYSNIRRFINDGQMPPADAVRIEEMVNYFRYTYPEPDGKDPLFCFRRNGNMSME